MGTMSTRQARQGFGEGALVIGLDAGPCERLHVREERLLSCAPMTQEAPSLAGGGASDVPGRN
jgi:hypothetical protein